MTARFGNSLEKRLVMLIDLPRRDAEEVGGVAQPVTSLMLREFPWVSDGLRPLAVSYDRAWGEGQEQGLLEGSKW